MMDLSVFSDEELIGILDSDASDELKKRGYKFGWYKTESFVGDIYILVNPAFPDLVKIGYADDVQKRLKALNRNSGLPDPFHCYAIYRVKKRLEDLKLHSLIDALDGSLRHSRNREFYEMNYKKAYDILSAIAQINGEEENLRKNPFSDSYFDDTSNDSEDRLENRKSRSGTKERLKFNMLGIPVGSVLVFSKDERITCTTKDDINKVEYNGEIYPISRLAAKLLNISAAQGGMYFKYNGETLTDIRKRIGK